jgi:hypothetical protein
MTVALSSSGDKDAPRGDAAVATGVVPPQVPPALGRALWRPAVRGSRFWALAGESSDEESEGEDPEVGVSSPLLVPSVVTVGDFVCAALASGPAGFGRSASWARKAFAPGGHGPRWLSSSTVSAVRRPPSSSSSSLPVAEVSQVPTPAGVALGMPASAAMRPLCLCAGVKAPTAVPFAGVFRSRSNPASSLPDRWTQCRRIVISGQRSGPTGQSLGLSGLRPWVGALWSSRHI